MEKSWHFWNTPIQLQRLLPTKEASTLDRLQFSLGLILHLINRNRTVQLIRRVTEEVLDPLGGETSTLEIPCDGVSEDVRVDGFSTDLYTMTNL